MKFSEAWLRSYVNPDWTTEALADALTMAGLEVEASGPFAPPFNGVVVAKVLAVGPHPDADKLKVCEVDAGGAPRTIVCGAPNVEAGMRVPCALPGARLPGGLEIRSSKVRGVASDGMLCSARELGLSDDHAGLMRLNDLPGAREVATGTDLRAALALDDTVFELKLTPNRPDCLGVFGIAREVAAISGAPLTAPGLPPVPVSIDDRLPVVVQAPDLCGRFAGRVIRGVNAAAATPAWMRERLERAGQRSISALVDISNYVMLELGRPTHVFDLDRIHGDLEVRWARTGEQLELLNGQTVTLDARFGVIADAQQLESLAGIMGGEATAVTTATTNIYVEAAFWWPNAIAGRSRELNFSTDAGHRFERGVDAETTAAHLEYLSALILQICGGQAGPLDDQILALPAREPVTMRADRARKVIGAPISDDEMAAVFSRLGFEFSHEEGRFIVVPPSFRFDLNIEEDLIEEVVRIWGYDRLPVAAPRAGAAMRDLPEDRSPMALRRLIAARDYQEVINYSFVSAAEDGHFSDVAPIRLLNPMVAQMDVMRTNLFVSLLGNLRQNLNRKAPRVRLFEFGRIYRADPSIPDAATTVRGIDQPWRVGLLAHGPAAPEQWGLAPRPVDFHDLKGDLESLLDRADLRFEAEVSPGLHPGRSASIWLDKRRIGRIGSLHPALQQQFDLAQPPILAELDRDVLLERALPKILEVSNYPPVMRDLAWVVPEHLEVQKLLEEMHAAAATIDQGARIIKIKLFDEYRGKGLENKEKSLAFRFWMQDTQRTLSDAEVAGSLAVIVDRVQRNLGARLRA